VAKLCAFGNFRVDSAGMARAAEIVIIGAGVVGCTIAFELARRGAAVKMVDGRSVGEGATQASAGILAPYLESRDGGPLLGLTTRSLDLFDEFVAQVSSASGVAVPYRRTGTLDVATDDADVRELSTTASLLTSRGVAAEWLDGAAARLEEPQLTSHALGALSIGAHGFVSAPELTRAAATAAQRLGAQIVPPAHVTRLSRSNGNISIEADGTVLRADAVVLAAGCWSGQVDVDGAGVRIPVRPVRGQLLHLAWNGEPLRRVIWSQKCYLVPWHDGTVLVGATVEEAGFEERATVAGVRDLLDAACDVVPHTWTASFLAARVGLRPGTPDNLPVIGRSRVMPGLLYATGHFRNGVLLAPLTARIVADALLDGRMDPVLAITDPERFGDL
jgi:glycine oxidase